MRASRLSVIVFAVLALPLESRAAFAQTPTGVVPPSTPDADALASEMRLLGADPKNLSALIRAGELTLKLDDPTAAAGFFARAERLDPRNPRIKAGMGSLLVEAERPGEALLRFKEAEALGLDSRNFAADRGLAYDLIGEQERAQRDYRLALKNGTDDETIRRYALSLGISGKRDKALEQLDPLLRKSDRGAWRARAFILAMGGDQSGADRIATTMMPAGLAQGLQPFFVRLPALSAADRAFAVHFGEIRPTPQRIADARLVPALAPLVPEPGEIVAVAAAAQPVAPRPDRREDRRKEKKKRKRDSGRVEIATATTPPPVPLPAPPAYVAESQAQMPYRPPGATQAPTPARAASATLVPATPVVPNSASRLASAQPARAASATPLPAKPVVPNSATRLASAQPARPPVGSPASGPVASLPIAGSADNGVAPTARHVIEPPLAATSVRSTPAGAPPSARSAELAAQPASVPTTTHTPVRSEDSILAAIVANIAVPGSELVEQSSSPVPVAAQPTRVEPAAASPLSRPAANSAALGGATDARAAANRAVQAKAAADRKALADKKALADQKALADKKIADAKKAADAKLAAEEKKKNDPKRLEPSRVWVQVAGGATVRDMPKQWARVRENAPAMFKGKQGWTTPLRATYRLLTGPFKSDDEAQIFVNILAKSGISAFTFISEAGQKIEKLPAP